MPTNEKGSSAVTERALKTQNTRSDRITLKAADQSGTQRAPYSMEVARAVAAGKHPNVYIFAGKHAWERAAARHKAIGSDSAMVLPNKSNPLDLTWPAVQAVVVAWPGRDDINRKFDLAKALIRDGVRSAHIEHEPEWIQARAKAVSA